MRGPGGHGGGSTMSGHSATRDPAATATQLEEAGPIAASPPDAADDDEGILAVFPAGQLAGEAAVTAPARIGLDTTAVLPYASSRTSKRTRRLRAWMLTVSRRPRRTAGSPVAEPELLAWHADQRRPRHGRLRGRRALSGPPPPEHPGRTAGHLRAAAGLRRGGGHHRGLPPRLVPYVSGSCTTSRSRRAW